MPNDSIKPGNTNAAIIDLLTAVASQNYKRKLSSLKTRLLFWWYSLALLVE